MCGAHAHEESAHVSYPDGSKVQENNSRFRHLLRRYGMELEEILIPKHEFRNKSEIQ